MQGLSAFLTALAAGLAAMLAGHLALSRTRERGPALAFLLAFTLQCGLLLVQLLRPGLLPAGLRAATGSALPVLLYLFFARSRPGAGAWRPRDGVHVLPVALVTCLVVMPNASWRIDAALLLIELGYALALLSSDRRDREHWGRQQARQVAAAFLLAMAGCDVWIGWELAAGGSLAWMPSLTIALGLLTLSVGALFVLAWRDPEWLVRWRDNARHEPKAPPALAPVLESDSDYRLCARLDALFQSTRRYAEFGIGLDEVAIMLGVPARQLSAAVNRVRGRGFRTLLNDFRVDDAARQLADAGLAGKPITEVMFDAGFQTKSNFNKEFVARLGVPPSLYRKQHANAASVKSVSD